MSSFVKLHHFAPTLFVLTLGCQADVAEPQATDEANASFAIPPPNPGPGTGPKTGANYPPNPPAAYGRPCRSDLFFFEKELWESAFSPTFAPTLADNITAQIQNTWFCDPADPVCAGTKFTAQMVSVLPQRSAAYRTDGHLRFYRMYFVDATGERQRVRPAHLCEVVSLLRDRADVLALGAKRVGRECEAMVMGTNGLLSTAAKQWHWGEVGASTTPDMVVPGAGPSVRVALIDSGVPASRRAIVGITQEQAYVDIDTGTQVSGDYHPHGTAMSGFFRHLDANAELISYRALDQNGIATTASLGQAIDEAIYDGSNLPLVMMMSLGFPPEMSSRSELITGPVTAPTCRIEEDGVGEVVRYVLDVARQIDNSGTRRISSFSAAGNRAAPLDPSVFRTINVHTSPCGGPGSADSTDGFFPGEYGRLSSCRLGRPPWTLTQPIGAIDSRREHSSISMKSAASPLVAPGQHVFATRGLSNDEYGYQCFSQTGHSESFEQTMYTGTSVAAALTTGVAARVQAALVASPIGALSSDALTRLLYMTGDRVCMTSAEGARVTKVSLSNALRAISGCPALVECAANAILGPRAIEVGTFNRCAAARAACGIGNVCVTPPPIDVAPGRFRNYIDCKPGYACAPIQAGCGTIKRACGKGGCPAYSAPNPPAADRHSLAGLGPLPPNNVCPECFATFADQGAWGIRFDLLAQLWDGFDPAETTFTDPQLWIRDGNDELLMKVNLLSYSNAEDWVPGKVVMLKGINATELCDAQAECTSGVLEALISQEPDYRVEFVVNIKGGELDGLNVSAVFNEPF